MLPLRPRHPSSVVSASASALLCLGSITLTFCLDCVHSLYSIIILFYHIVFWMRVDPSQLSLPRQSQNQSQFLTPALILLPLPTLTSLFHMHVRFLVFFLSSPHKTTLLLLNCFIFSSSFFHLFWIDICFYSLPLQWNFISRGPTYFLGVRR